MNALKTWLLLILALGLAPSTWAACRTHHITPPEQVNVVADSVMIVVHQSATYDARYSTKRGVDAAVKFAKEKNIPVIYLQDDTPDEYYFMADCNPDYWVFSEGGEIRFNVQPSHVYIVGGHLELCMSAALHDIIYQWSRRPPQNFRVTYFMDAIYSNGKLIEPTDPYFADFTRFLNIVTYGRPGGEHWPKLSLLETMGIIIREEHELEYLKKVLPRWDTTFSEIYQVELKLDGSAKQVLRAGNGWNPPTVTFEFFDSAMTLGL